VRQADIFSRLAMDLDQQLYGRVSAPVLFIHSWFINHWLQPMTTNVEFASEAANVGARENDTLYGCFSAAGRVMYQNLSGLPLSQVVEDADRQLARIADRVRVAAFHCTLERQVAQALMGRTAHRVNLSDDRFDEQRDVASICRTSNYNQIAYYYVAMLRLHYYYGDYDTALDFAARAQAVLPAFQGQVAEWEFVFFTALATAARATAIGSALDAAGVAAGVSADATLGADDERAKLLATVDELLARFEAWADAGPDSFTHKHDLIRAERLHAGGEPDERDEAMAAYYSAIESAAISGFVHDQALAHERAALFFGATGDAARETTHFREAEVLYRKWEAWAKADEIAARSSRGALKYRV
jgi:hypothetical protein